MSQGKGLNRGRGHLAATDSNQFYFNFFARTSLDPIGQIDPFAHGNQRPCRDAPLEQAIPEPAGPVPFVNIHGRDMAACKEPFSFLS